MNNIHKTLREAYLDYVNDYKKIEAYAEANELTEPQAFNVLALGMQIHQQYSDISTADKELNQLREVK